MITNSQYMVNPFQYKSELTVINKQTTRTNGESFRISKILESHGQDETRASTSAEAATTLSCEEDRSVSTESRQSGTPHSSVPCGKKARKARTIFTDKQLQELEATFGKQKYLSVQDRMDLAHRMGLTDTQVKTWYQNRRTKWKRQAAVGMDLLNEASNVAAVQQLLRTNPYWANYMAVSSFAQPRLQYPMQSTVFPGSLSLALSGVSSSSFPSSPTRPLTRIGVTTSVDSSSMVTPSFASPAIPLAMFPFQFQTAGYSLNVPNDIIPEISTTPTSFCETKAESNSG